MQSGTEQFSAEVVDRVGCVEVVAEVPSNTQLKLFRAKFAVPIFIREACAGACMQMLNALHLRVTMLWLCGF